MAGEVTVSLTKDQALVLFEFLARIDPDATSCDVQEAELLVLWRIEGQLEKTPVEPLVPNYSELLEQARKRVLSSG